MVALVPPPEAPMRFYRHASNIYYYCPACRQAHSVPVDGSGPPKGNWELSGTYEHPTLNPSVRHYVSIYDNSVPPKKIAEKTTCHYYVKAGRIEFCNDNPHALNKQKVELPDFPSGYGLPGDFVAP